MNRSKTLGFENLFGPLYDDATEKLICLSGELLDNEIATESNEGTILDKRKANKFRRLRAARKAKIISTILHLQTKKNVFGKK